MATEPSLPRLTFTNVGVIFALAISIGNGIWNTAVLSSNVQADHERIASLEKSIDALKEDRADYRGEFEGIKAKLDLLLKDRERRHDR